MFVWGSTVHGELGVGGVEEEHILVPQKLDWSESQNVVSTALGDNHTLLLTTDGKIYSCGDNDYGQLGHEQPRKRPQLVSGLDAHFIVAVACGKAHSLALNKWGHVFAWGSDSSGQLGHAMGEVIQPVPKIVKSLAKYHIVQISCGRLHSVALSNSGDVLCWGANSFGELGIGHTSPYESTPVLLRSLRGIPFALISCGSHHTFALSKSGAVFGWGKNMQGQLGLNDINNRVLPSRLRTLRSIKVSYINCGEDYSMFLTLDGGVFSCGSGTNGQLGHGTTTSEILPRQIFELMGSTITQISCGRKHTLAFVSSGGRVYSFGVGGSGQLGLKKITNTTTPQVVNFPWLSTSSATSSVLATKNEIYDVQRIFAGGDRSIVLVKNDSEKTVPFDCRRYEKATQIEQVDVDYMLGYLNCNNDTTIDQDFMSYLESVFKSLQCLNGSFLLANNAHYSCSSKHHGVNMELAEKCFSIIGKYENDTIKELIWCCIVEDILPKLSPSPPDVETLRIYLTIPLYHEFNNPKQHLKLHKPFASALLKLTVNANSVVGKWWRMMTPEYFEKLVNIFKSVVIFIMRGQKIPERETVMYDASLEATLNILSVLNKLNHLGDGFKVPYDIFHISDLSEHVDVRMDYALWLSDTNPGKLFLCNYPFIFDAPAKTLLLETDQSFQMHSAMQNAAKEAFISMLVQPSIPMSVNQYLVLNVHRDHLVQDALRELSSVTCNDLKKPLKVKFFGEEAEDAGGVSKEFFLLLLREILDPIYGMFKEYEETRAVWFSDNTFENGDVFLLIGMICGLAIYNFTIINIPFPLALYKKLLEEPIGLADMKGLSPTVYNSLQAILDYQMDDLAEVFALNFEISKDVYGEITSVPLKPNGNNIAVTQENKQDYVDLYIDYVFNKSVEKEYSAFHEGFMKVCGGRVLKLFHSHELMAVVIGNENYDWHALEEHAEYKNGFESSSQTIRWFWEVLHEMSLSDKKKFLLFLTGSDRIPIQGMKAIKIIIQKTNDDKYLPVAHTCFNLLDLPEYKTKERLRYKLMQAIQQTEGFSLV